MKKELFAPLTVAPGEVFISVENLSKVFGSFTAVDHLNFTIRKGEILGFLGPNGAGKTTTIKMLNGLLRISSGRIMVAGCDAEIYRREFKSICGYMSQKFSLYPSLNALENIEFFGGISGLPRARIRQQQQAILEELGETVLRQRVEDIPPGLRQKVAMFVCLLTDPQIIFLDEPTSGVDPEARRSFWQEIYALKQAGKTILVTTHNLDEVEYADRLLIIHQGRLIVEGEPQELLKQHGHDSVEALFKAAINKNDQN